MGDGRPSREDLERRVGELEAENAELRALVVAQAALIEKLTVEIAELRARLDMNPRNSSKPPSGDGYAKPAPKSRRGRSGKNPGKQPDHHPDHPSDQHGRTESDCCQGSTCWSTVALGQGEGFADHQRDEDGGPARACCDTAPGVSTARACCDTAPGVSTARAEG